MYVPSTKEPKWSPKWLPKVLYSWGKIVFVANRLTKRESKLQPQLTSCCSLLPEPVSVTLFGPDSLGIGMEVWRELYTSKHINTSKCSCLTDQTGKGWTWLEVSNDARSWCTLDPHYILCLFHTTQCQEWSQHEWLRIRGQQGPVKGEGGLWNHWKHYSPFISWVHQEL